jgi:Amt family ammonium transporter
MVSLSKYLGSDIKRGGWFSINVSGQSVSDPNFTTFVIEQIEKAGLPPQAICFELTETSAISNLASAIEFINTMQEKGCRIALDDFGSGLSSFSYLKNLNIDYLKIDGTFVRDMHEDRVAGAMVEAITNVAREMQIGVIAEWVEKHATIKQLQKLNVEFAQGYAFSEPMPIQRLDLNQVAN